MPQGGRAGEATNDGPTYSREVARLLKGEREYDDPILGLETLPVTFEKTAERHTGRRAQLYKGDVYDRSLVAREAVAEAPAGAYRPLTYGQTRDIVRKLATGFRALGVDDTDRVGIFSGPRMEWTQSDLALLSTGATVTTIYESASPQQVRYLLADAGASGVVVENQRLLERVLEVIDDINVRFVAAIDEIDPDYAAREGVYTLGEVYKEGAKRYDAETYRSWIDEVDLGDLATIVYTSGRTGRPRGVKLTHRNVRANVNQAYRRLAPRPERPDGAATVEPADRVAARVPLADPFGRTMGQFLPFAVGSTIGYPERSGSLVEDFRTLEPTVVVGVPQAYERLYEAIRKWVGRSEIRGYEIGENVFDWAVDVGRQRQAASRARTFLKLKGWIADGIVRERVREALGGDVELLLTGGGAVTPDLTRLYRAVGLPLVQGYGIPEAGPLVALNPPEVAEADTIGLPVPALDARLDESVVPEGQFDDVAGELGELQVRGPNVTEGYWNLTEETEEVFTDDDYLKTGDIVQRRPDGYLAFQERKKRIFYLSNGKSVAPSPIEDSLVDGEVIDQAMVLGDGREYPVALVVPDFQRLREAAEREGVSIPEEHGQMCRDDNVRAAIRREIDRVNDDFEAHEQVEAFRAVPDPWTEENGLVTPSQKKKRQQILDRHSELVAEMYDGTTESSRPAEPAD